MLSHQGIALWQRDAAIQTPTGAVQSRKSALPAEWHHTQWLTERTRAWLRQRRLAPAAQARATVLLLAVLSRSTPSLLTTTAVLRSLRSS